MKKRIMGVFLAAVLLVSQAAAVFAADSKTAEVTVSDDSASYYEISEGTEAVFSYLAENHPRALELILAINNGSLSLQTIAEHAPELAEILQGKSAVTRFFELSAINGGWINEAGNHVVTFGVPALTNSMSDVRLIHYSVARGKWEAITPADVDYASKQITAEFKDLSPVIVIAKLDPSADSAVGTSPKTGNTPVWLFLIGAALILGTAGAAVYRKSRI